MSLFVTSDILNIINLIRFFKEKHQYFKYLYTFINLIVNKLDFANQQRNHTKMSLFETKILVWNTQLKKRREY